MNDELKLKNNLKEARAEKKLSQTQLAEMIGVSRNTISSIETGQFWIRLWYSRQTRPAATKQPYKG